MKELGLSAQLIAPGKKPGCTNNRPEDYWSCIAHLSAADMLKSADIEEKKFKRSPWAGADNH